MEKELEKLKTDLEILIRREEFLPNFEIQSLEDDIFIVGSICAIQEAMYAFIHICVNDSQAPTQIEYYTCNSNGKIDIFVLGKLQLCVTKCLTRIRETL